MSGIRTSQAFRLSVLSLVGTAAIGSLAIVSTMQSRAMAQTAPNGAPALIGCPSAVAPGPRMPGVGYVVKNFLSTTYPQPLTASCASVTPTTAQISWKPPLAIGWGWANGVFTSIDSPCGSVSFTNPSGLSTGVNFTRPGAFKIKASAKNGIYETFSNDITVVSYPTVWPKVSVGPDQQIRIGADGTATLNLNASVTEPSPSMALSGLSWRYEGPAGVRFDQGTNPDLTRLASSTPAPKATFTKPGIYRLSLTWTTQCIPASYLKDGNPFMAIDDMIVTVLPR